MNCRHREDDGKYIPNTMGSAVVGSLQWVAYVICDRLARLGVAIVALNP